MVATLELLAARAAKVKLENDVASEQVDDDLLESIAYVWDNTPDSRTEKLRESILDVASRNWAKLFGTLDKASRQGFIARCPSFIDSITMRLMQGGVPLPTGSETAVYTIDLADQDDDDMDTAWRGSSHRHRHGGGRRLG